MYKEKELKSFFEKCRNYVQKYTWKNKIGIEEVEEYARDYLNIIFDEAPETFDIGEIEERWDYLDANERKRANENFQYNMFWLTLGFQKAFLKEPIDESIGMELLLGFKDRFWHSIVIDADLQLVSGLTWEYIERFGKLDDLKGNFFYTYLETRMNNMPFFSSDEIESLIQNVKKEPEKTDGIYNLYLNMKKQYQIQCQSGKRIVKYDFLGIISSYASLSFAKKYERYKDDSDKLLSDNNMYKYFYSMLNSFMDMESIDKNKYPLLSQWNELRENHKKFNRNEYYVLYMDQKKIDVNKCVKKIREELYGNDYLIREEIEIIFLIFLLIYYNTNKIKQKRIHLSLWGNYSLAKDIGKLYLELNDFRFWKTVMTRCEKMFMMCCTL